MAFVNNSKMGLLLLPIAETLILQMELDQLFFWSSNGTRNETQLLLISELCLSLHVSSYKRWIRILIRVLFFGSENNLFVNRRFGFLQDHHLTSITIKRKDDNWKVEIKLEENLRLKSEKSFSKLYKLNYIN